MSTANLKMNCLVSGYLKQEFLQLYEYQYPESLTVIFVHFLGNVLFGFDLIYDQYKHFISNEGKVLDINGLSSYITVACSYPLNAGIYTIVVKTCNNYLTNPIGIISDERMCFKDTKWIFSGEESYSYALYQMGLVQSDLADKYFDNEYYKADYGNMMKNDKVKLIINCNEWKLSYFWNDKQIGKDINIAKDITYYFAICNVHNYALFDHL